MGSKYSQKFVMACTTPELEIEPKITSGSKAQSRHVFISGGARARRRETLLNTNTLSE
jgi:hypothetical protein